MFEKINSADTDISATLRQQIPDELYENLRVEALSARPSSQRVESDICDFEPDGAVNGRGRCFISGPSEHLRSFHSGMGLRIAQEFVGGASKLYPTRASYLFYEVGDYAFLHHDAIHAHVTVIVGLSPGLLPLATYPNFTGISKHDVHILNNIDCNLSEDFTNEINRQFGIRATRFEVEIAEQHAVAIRGRRIPHARPRQDTPGMVCTVCYTFLKPPKEWNIV